MRDLKTKEQVGHEHTTQKHVKDNRHTNARPPPRDGETGHSRSLRGGTRTGEGHRHSYQAIAIFDFYGTTRESAPTAAETVTSTFNPFTLIVQ